MKTYVTKRVGDVIAVVDEATKLTLGFVRDGRLTTRSDLEGTEAYARATARWDVVATLPVTAFYDRLNGAI